MAKNDKLTLSKLNNEASKLNQMKSVTVLSATGKTFTIDICKIITNTQVDKIYTDMVQYLTLLNDLDIDQEDKVTISGTDLRSIANQYLSTCIIANLTSLVIPESVTERIAVTSNLYNLGLLEEIVSKFDEDEMERAMTKLTTLIQEFGKGVDQLKQKLDEQLKEIEYREQVEWEVDEKIAQINEIEMKDESASNVVSIEDHKKD